MASQPQSVYKSAMQGAKQSVIATAQALRRESNETLKTAQDQIGLPVREGSPQPESARDIPQVVQEIRNDGPAAIDREAIAREEQSMLASLESQLANLRQQREKDLASYNETQQKEMEALSRANEPAPVEAPQGKIKKALGQAKKAVTGLITSRKQSETKQGTGKG